MAERPIGFRLSSRRILFIGLFLLFTVFDYVHIAGIDSITKENRGYGHQQIAKQWEGAAETENARGWDRVGFNFRHFFKWWVILPQTKGSGIKRVLTSDGNGLLNNLGGHFLGGTLLVLIALWLSRSVPLVTIAGTAINLFHEYVAEGRFCDPSLVDLWLDQAGIFLAVVLYKIITMKIHGNRFSYESRAKP